MEDTKGKALGLLSGIGLCLALAACVVGLHLLLVYFFPSTQTQRVPWVTILTVFVLPEAIFVTGVVMLWQKRRAMAVGILISALVLGAHFAQFAIHVASRWGG